MRYKLHSLGIVGWKPLLSTPLLSSPLLSSPLLSSPLLSLLVLRYEDPVSVSPNQSQTRMSPFTHSDLPSLSPPPKLNNWIAAGCFCVVFHSPSAFFFFFTHIHFLSSVPSFLSFLWFQFHAGGSFLWVKTISSSVNGYSILRNSAKCGSVLFLSFSIIYSIKPQILKSWLFSYVKQCGGSGDVLGVLLWCKMCNCDISSCSFNCKRQG